MRKGFHLGNERVFCFQIPGIRTGVSVYHGLLLRVLVVRDNKIYIHVLALQRTTRNCSKVRFFFFLIRVYLMRIMRLNFAKF